MTSIFVAKLDFGVSNLELRQLFERYGKVNKATVATDRETGKPRGFAFVEMDNDQEAKEAIEALDGHVINGRALAVKEAEQRTDNRSTTKPFAPRQDDSMKKANESLNSSRESNEPNSDISPSSTEYFLPKSEPRKKAKEKDRKIDDDNRSKKPKMDAYKKSGKNNRFYDDDDLDDIDDELLNYKKLDEDDFFEEEEEDEL